MERHLVKIKKIFKENFLLDLGDEEALAIYESMIPQTTAVLADMPGYSEAKAKRYMEGEVELVFSPRSIRDQVLRIANEIGLEALEDSHRHKRLYEMVMAMDLALALKKKDGREWMIKSQDNPDILLVSPSGEAFDKKPFHAVPLEIMQIPEEAKATFKGELEADIAEFIRTKKFTKRYEGPVVLLVHLNFTHQGLKMRRISEVLNSFSDNPYHQIWGKATTDPSFRTIQAVLLTPEFGVIEINIEREPDLLF